MKRVRGGPRWATCTQTGQDANSLKPTHFPDVALQTRRAEVEAGCEPTSKVGVGGGGPHSLMSTPGTATEDLLQGPICREAKARGCGGAQMPPAMELPGDLQRHHSCPGLNTAPSPQALSCACLALPPGLTALPPGLTAQRGQKLSQLSATDSNEPQPAPLETNHHPEPDARTAFSAISVPTTLLERPHFGGAQSGSLNCVTSAIGAAGATRSGDEHEGLLSGTAQLGTATPRPPRSPAIQRGFPEQAAGVGIRTAFLGYILLLLTFLKSTFPFI